MAQYTSLRGYYAHLDSISSKIPAKPTFYGAFDKLFKTKQQP
jgi:hypothetical protein